ARSILPFSNERVSSGEESRLFFSIFVAAISKFKDSLIISIAESYLRGLLFQNRKTGFSHHL
ncbi:MAG TPA: hypothetical protein VFY68_05525, partial [Nitrososphaeraceae archaeon]|nr:hypothetical protein [Nitrososphaeraceae archaeon]